MPFNLVFQGGGVRGIAYAGALESLPNETSIKGVGGTSAGAIVAALIGIGYSPSDIKQILQDSAISDLLHQADIDRLKGIEASIEALKPLLAKAMNSGDISYWSIWRNRKHLKSVISEAGKAWQERGLHKSDKLGQWLNKIFKSKTFADATSVEDLQIVAADVSRQRFQVYQKSEHGGMPLAQAVHASTSIPLFFHPFGTGTDLLVDGGILSNYPSFLFADSKYPTVGFRLVDLVPPEGTVSGTLQYLQAVLQTMVEAHDKKRDLPRHIFTYPIPTPPHIPFNKFQLTQTDIAELVNAGQMVGRLVPWKEHERQERKVEFFDPKADETLDFSVSQARELYESFSQQESWVETLHHEAELTVRIDKDWTTTYERKSTMEVLGTRNLFVTRYRAVGLPQNDGVVKSLMDIEVLAQETTDLTNPRDLIRIPAYNSKLQKGFVLFYTPPVSQETGKRSFRSTFTIHQEFLLVPKGEPGVISYGVQRLAEDHFLKLTLRVLTEVNMPKLIFTNDFGVNVRTSSGAKQVGEKFYTERFWDIARSQVHGEALFNVNVRIDSERSR
jgi:NTE family protein